MQLQDLIGQARPAAILRNAMLRGRVAHSYLFWGPEAVGKSTAALLFACALNCEDEEARGSGSACGRCRSCRLVAKGNHPDVRLIDPTSPSDSSVVPIEEMRKHLVYDVHLKPVIGRHKIYLLDPADRTAPLAIHTILRVLEEPPPYAVIILVTSRPALLPATIPSRCQQVAFQLVGTDAIQRHLLTLDVEPLTAASLARLSGGRVAWAIRAAQHPDVLSARKALLDLCASTQTQGIPAALRLAEDIKLQAAALALARAGAGGEEEAEREKDLDERAGRRASGDRALRAELPWCLDIMASWYRDRLAAPQGGALLNPDYEATLRNDLSPGTSAEEENAVEAILEAKHTIQRNANIDLALESLAIRLLSRGD